MIDMVFHFLVVACLIATVYQGIEIVLIRKALERCRPVVPLVPPRGHQTAKRDHHAGPPAGRFKGRRFDDEEEADIEAAMNEAAASADLFADVDVDQLAEEIWSESRKNARGGRS